MTNENQNVTKVKRQSKNKIRVDFERTSLWQRLRIKYLSLGFLGRVVFIIFRIVLLLGISYIILYPFISKIAGSIMTPEDFADVTVALVSRNPTFDTYKAILNHNEFTTAMTDTAVLSLVCALIQTFSCCVVAYGFAKYKFRGNKVLFVCVVLTMIIPHTIIQTQMQQHFATFDIGMFGKGLVRTVFGGMPLNLINTHWPLMVLSITALAFKNGLFIFMLRQFFKNIPDELEESAYIDGSGIFRTFGQIILPLSIPMLITVFLFAFSWQWTDDFYVSLFYLDQEKFHAFSHVYQVPQPFLDAVGKAGGGSFEAAIKNTVSLMIIAPLIVVYLFCQRFLVQGIERSGITG